MLPWERVRVFAHRMGVHVRVVRRVPAESPFTSHLGISWRDRVLYVRSSRLRDPLTVGGMIHELGHILATKVAPGPSEELDFVGWEWQAAKLCEVLPQWYRSMHPYGTDMCLNFGSLSRKDKLKFLRKHVKLGKELGNLSPSGRPLKVR